MNQREIKFRAWDGKKMLYSDNIGGFAIDDLRNGFWQDVMQFTGLKDKNGKEIYEGDILEALDKHKGFVKYEKDSFIVDGKATHIFYTSFRILSLHISQQEIIGNIYQNPELLNA